MTYQAIEQTSQDGRPALLATFERDGSTTRLCNQPNDIIIGGNTFVASPISFPASISRKARPEQEDLSFFLPLSDPFARAELGHDSIVSRVSIERTHLNDGDAEIESRWVGYLQRAEISGDTVELVCSSYRHGLNRSGQYAITQRTCRHFLYGSGCGVDIAAFQVARNVTAVNGTTLTISASVVDEEQHANGILEWNGQSLSIASVSGTTLILRRPNADLAAAVQGGAQSAQIAPGCQKNLTGCTFFSNVDNFGGFPYIPDRELFSGRSAV